MADLFRKGPPAPRELDTAKAPRLMRLFWVALVPKASPPSAVPGWLGTANAVSRPRGCCFQSSHPPARRSADSPRFAPGSGPQAGQSPATPTRSLPTRSTTAAITRHPDHPGQRNPNDPPKACSRPHRVGRQGLGLNRKSWVQSGSSGVATNPSRSYDRPASRFSARNRSKRNCPWAASTIA